LQTRRILIQSGVMTAPDPLSADLAEAHAMILVLRAARLAAQRAAPPILRPAPKILSAQIFATWGNCGRLLSGGVKSDRIGLGIGKGEQPWSSMLVWTYR
jgi:hypothetical protein